MLARTRRKLLSKIIEQETLIFPRTVETITKAEAAPPNTPSAGAPTATSEEIDDWAKLGDAWRADKKMPTEEGFTYKGNEPTMFGDWQHKGRTTDF